MNTLMNQLNHLPYVKEIYFVVFMVLLYFTRILLIRLLTRFISKRSTNHEGWISFLRSLINWSTFYASLFFVIGYFPEKSWLDLHLFSISDKAITPINLIVSFIIITLAFRLSQFLNRFLLKPSFRKYQLDEGVQYTFTRVSHYVIISLALLISFMNIGINLSALTVFASVLGVGVGFGLQNITSNFFSGIILLFERPIKVGDTVKIDDLICQVEEIRMRATIVRTLNNEHMIIPNSNFVENKIVNWSYSDEVIRLIIPVGVAYGSNVQLVKDLLLQAATEEKKVMTRRKPIVEFMEFGDSSLNFRLLVWVPNPDLRTTIISNLNFRINDLFADNNIEIPFPQRDLHIRSMDDKLLNKLSIMRKEDV